MRFQVFLLRRGQIFDTIRQDASFVIYAIILFHFGGGFMTLNKQTTVCLALLFALTLLAPVSAGLIDTGTHYGSWSGTTAFTGVTNPLLKGTIDWVVFGPGDFPFSGYSPTVGELTYAYQIHCTGDDAISTEIVPFPSANTADNVGAFSDSLHGVTGDAPTVMGLDPADSVYWLFSDIEKGKSSEGLVYSSPNVPQAWYSIIINGGTVAIADPIPAPSSTPIPEPASVWLLVSGLVALSVWRLRRR
jgi:hypothetical protein